MFKSFLFPYLEIVLEHRHADSHVPLLVGQPRSVINPLVDTVFAIRRIAIENLLFPNLESGSQFILAILDPVRNPFLDNALYEP